MNFKEYSYIYYFNIVKYKEYIFEYIELEKELKKINILEAEIIEFDLYDDYIKKDNTYIFIYKESYKNIDFMNYLLPKLKKIKKIEILFNTFNKQKCYYNLINLPKNIEKIYLNLLDLNPKFFEKFGNTIYLYDIDLKEIKYIENLPDNIKNIYCYNSFDYFNIKYVKEYLKPNMKLYLEEVKLCITNYE